jgi:hypothetical protein
VNLSGANLSKAELSESIGERAGHDQRCYTNSYTTAPYSVAGSWKLNDGHPAASFLFRPSIARTSQLRASARILGGASVSRRGFIRAARGDPNSLLCRQEGELRYGL